MGVENQGAGVDLKELITKSWEIAAIDFVDEKKCHAWILQQLRKNAGCCCFCGAVLRGKARESFLLGQRAKCHSCGRGSNCLAGTPFQGIHASLKEVFLLIVGHGLSLDDLEISRLLNRSPSSVRDWRRKRFEAVTGDAE